MQREYEQGWNDCNHSNTEGNQSSEELECIRLKIKNFKLSDISFLAYVIDIASGIVGPFITGALTFHSIPLTTSKAFFLHCIHWKTNMEWLKYNFTKLTSIDIVPNSVSKNIVRAFRSHNPWLWSSKALPTVPRRGTRRCTTIYVVLM